jgi:hypothetical protein
LGRPEQTWLSVVRADGGEERSKGNANRQAAYYNVDEDLDAGLGRYMRQKMWATGEEEQAELVSHKVAGRSLLPYWNMQLGAPLS